MIVAYPQAYQSIQVDYYSAMISMPQMTIRYQLKYNMTMMHGQQR